LCWGLLWAEYVPNQVLVKIKPEVSGIQTQGLNNVFSAKLKNLLDSQGAVSIRRVIPAESASGSVPRQFAVKAQSVASPLDRYYLAEYPATINVELLVELLKSDPEVEDAQPNYIYRLFDTVPNDTYYNSRQRDYLDQIAAAQGWDISTGSAAVTIAVVDTGVKSSHPDLAGKVVDGYNSLSDVEGIPASDDDNGHGTIVAGIAAAIGNNGTGVAGLDWNARIIAIKVFDASGTSGTSTVISRGIKKAADKGAQVINMSLGGISSNGDPLFKDVCDYAYDDKGAVLVAAMGNIKPENGFHKDSVVYPAALPNVIGVGSVDRNDNLSSFSVQGSGGHTVELVAPGEFIFSTSYDGTGYTLGSGTSFATPLVSGLAALLKGQNPALTNTEIRTILRDTAKDLGASGRDAWFGYGLINVYGALTRTPYQGAAGSKLEKVLSFPNPARDRLKFSFQHDKDVASVDIIIYDQRGRKITTREYGAGLAGNYVSPEWDLKTDDNKYLANGSYIYVVKVTSADGSVSYGRNVLTIVR
jgi:subtilisin family serine protease